MYVRYSRLAASTLAAPPSIRHAEGPSALHALITAGLAMAHGLDARSDARHPHHTSRRRPAKSAKQTPPLKSWLFSLCLPTFHAQGPARRSLPAWISILVARDPSAVQFVASAAIVVDPSKYRRPTTSQPGGVADIRRGLRQPSTWPSTAHTHSLILADRLPARERA